MLVYKITNKINNKIYIGITSQSLKKRWYNHCGKKSNCTLLRNAINKYGKLNFQIDQIDSASSKEDLEQKEKYWIAHYRSNQTKFGYNLLSGGFYKSKHSELTKQKMSLSRTGKIMPDTTRLALRKANTNRRMPEKVKKALLDANETKIVTEETRKKLSEKSKLKKLSESQKTALLNGSLKFKEDKERDRARIEKMKKTLTGKSRSVESRIKQSNTLKNKPLPEYAKTALNKTREYIKSRGWKCNFKTAKLRLIQELLTILASKGN